MDVGFRRRRAAEACRRRAFLAMRAGSRVLKRTPLRGVLDVRGMRWLHGRMLRPRMIRARDVLEVLDALDAAGVETSLTGGWGVDALLGEQTRRHVDLDVGLVAASKAQQERDQHRAEAALARLGFVVEERRHMPGVWMPNLTVMRDATGLRVDLLPLTEPGDEALATGAILGRPVRCISARLQLEYHSGYRPSNADRHDIALLCDRFGLSAPTDPGAGAELATSARRDRRDRQSEGPAATLLVPVPSVARALRDLCPPLDHGLPRHVTVLFPFLPPGGITAEVTAELRDVVAEFPAFGFRLAHLDRFPDVLYLAPEPEEPFRALTAALVARWPTCLPYGGAFDRVIPHVTVASVPAPEHLADDISRRLPLQADAREVWLMRPRWTGRWSRRASFPLGQGIGEFPEQSSTRFLDLEMRDRPF